MRPVLDVIEGRVEVTVLGVEGGWSPLDTCNVGGVQVDRLGLEPRQFGDLEGLLTSCLVIPEVLDIGLRLGLCVDLSLEDDLRSDVLQFCFWPDISEQGFLLWQLVLDHDIETTVGEFLDPIDVPRGR